MVLQKFYKKRIFIFTILSLLSFLVSIFSIININSNIKEHKNLENVISLSHEVRYYDEVLTMSSRMALYQDTLYWNDRYYNYVEKLDSAISQIKESMPIVRQKLEEVDGANIKLVELEEKALKMARDENYDEAKQLLFSKEYKEAKDIYALALDESLELLNQETSILENEFSKSILISSFIALFFILLVLGLSYYVFKYLSNYNRVLEEEVKEQIKKLTKQDLLLIEQSKLASLGEMLESIAHQWRQPLSSITTSVSGIKFRKRFDDLDDETLEHSLDNISNATQHLATTIEVFRQFHKDDIKKEFSLKEMFEKVQVLLASRFKNKEIKVVNEFKDYVVLGRENELIQVIINIFSNAIDELENLESEPKLIKIQTKENKEFISIEIIDNAGGIDESIISEVFDYKFSTKKDKNGTGIGLYMSKLIIEKAKGSISVENEEFYYNNQSFKGACFKLDIKK
ncbi:sensor histidine kinase [Arcobacter sp. YIC-464]|uniref:sensor histidine kinase n=1 Tax=Arcobacter sp. YIC-464 TaxID=3376631 RepID=UPI003C229580